MTSSADTVRRPVAAVLAALLLASCGGTAAGEQSPEALLAESCARDGGWRIHETVQVSGFLDRSQPEAGPNRVGCRDSCETALLDLRYSFVEAESDRADQWGIVPGPGLYRFSLRPAGHPACALFYRKLDSYGARSASRYASECIATEPVDRIASAYALEGAVELRKHSRGDFTEVRVNVVQLSSHKSLAEFRKYSFRWSNHQGSSCPIGGYMTQLRTVLVQSR